MLLPLFVKAQVPTIEEKTKTLQVQPGFIKLYTDSFGGKIYWEIDQWDKEILYNISMPAAIGSNDIGLDRGLMGQHALIKFQRAGNKVLMIQPNYRYRASSNSLSEKRAVEESFAQSALWGFAVEAQTGDRVLVDATNFLLRDAMQVVNILQLNRQGSYTLDASRSTLYWPRTKNFPFNTEMESFISFTTKDPRPGEWVRSVTPSADVISVRIHHSFARLPDDNFKPRVFDPRSGSIPISYYDYSTPVTEPIEKHFIIRHRLEKKDPLAPVSEAVKPIIYYLDNGTPEPIRSALLDGAKWWNQAFEAAGYKDAFQVKILPDTADPMDIRYNMINWVHRSTRGWSYGYSVVDPRTGEIIKGNVSLGSLRVRQDYLIATGLLSPFKEGVDQDPRMLAMALQRLRQLSAHEIGHTLGFMHNYISSAQGKASVMDYPAPDAVINKDGEIDLRQAYTNEIGDWDKVTVAYAYQDFSVGTNEKVALEKILKDAEAKGLSFISDRDARDPGGIHPGAHLWDNGKDIVDGLKEVMKVRQKALDQFGINSIRKGTAMAMLEEVLVPVYLYHRYQVEAAVKLVGGLNYTYAVKGDVNNKTYQLGKETEKKALDAVLATIDPKFLALPEAITQLIPPRPAGYSNSRELFSKRTGLAFDALSAAESATDLSLKLLLHPARLNRLSQQVGKGLSLNEVLSKITTTTWKAPRATGLEGLIQQQNEQIFLEVMMGALNSNETSFATKGILLHWLEEIRTFALRQSKLVNSPGRGHYLLALEKIEKKYEAKSFIAMPMPPGAPIGCGE
jgi:hypothetical protein